MTLGCLCCGPTKPISHFESQSTPTTAEFQLLKNPRTFAQTPLHDEKVTVWRGFTASTVIGPFFFKKMRDSGFETVSMRGERYANMLQNRYSLANKQLLESMTFIQDGAPPHIARQVKDLLRRSFGDDRLLSCHFRSFFKCILIF